MREAGILLPISSLPGEHGIGDFGKYAYEFVDIIKSMGNNLWQILPLNPLGYGESPYQAYSSYAGDEIYINLTLLKQAGYIKEEIPLFQENSEKVDYQSVREFKAIYLKKAFENFIPTDEYNQFIQQEWVYQYAVFITLKKLNHLMSWNLWCDEHKSWIENRQYDISQHDKAIRYEMFVQFIFFTQWMQLKTYANKQGIKMIGDMPIYTGFDSLDVWANKKAYLLDENDNPTFVAGVAPDYFSATGQRWGNPIYDWQYLENTHFDFWVKRLAYADTMFDYVRIDHFRAFDTYWKIPAHCETAIEGAWIEAPGYALFDVITTKLPNIQIIAEDLGDLRPEVLQLRDHYHLKGMKIVQHMMDFDKEAMLNESCNMVVYTGTHDNQTIQGWLNELDDTTLNKMQKFFTDRNYRNSTLCENYCEYTYHTLANMAILPVVDLLGLDDSARFNMPGVLNDSNWRWKLKNFAAFKNLTEKISKWIKESKRA